MSKKFFVFALILSTFVFFGCNDTLEFSSKEEYGSLRVVTTDSSRVMTVSEIASATVSVHGNGIREDQIQYIPVNVSDGKNNGDIRIDYISAGKNRIVKVEAQNVSGIKITDYVIAAVVDIDAGRENTVMVNWASSVKGLIYYAANEKGLDVTNDTISSKLNAIAQKFTDATVHASLINVDKIANDFSSINQDSFNVEDYKRTTKTVAITAYRNKGKTIQISDPNSTSVRINEDEATVTIPNVLEGTWNLYVNGKILKKITVGEDEETITVGTKPKEFNGIQIQVAKSLGYNKIHYWDCSDKNKYPNTTWPGVMMISDWCEDDYIYNFEDVTSVSILITKGSGDKLCDSDIKITNAGSYRITNSGKADSTYIPDVPPAPEPPTYTMPSQAYIGGSFSIRVSSASPLTVSTVTINGIPTTLTVGENSFNVGLFTSSEGTLTVSGTLQNEDCEETTAISGSITVSTRPAFDGPTEWNELRIYQVMVSSFQDGDSSIGYKQAYGPRGALTGGDLQGIINALDYIKDLGCNALWMTPIFDSTMSQNEYLNSTGYFCSDYFNIDPNFGTKQKFAELVEKAHERGIGVILDGVYGHWGAADVKPSPTGKKPTRSHGQYKACDFPASLPFFQEVAEYWIKEYKIDGWRFDQCYQVGLGDNAGGDGDNCYTGGHNYWYDIRRTIEAAASANGNLGTAWGTLGYTVGEHWKGDATIIQNGSVTGGNAPGDGLRSCFDFPARYQIVQSLAKEEGTNVGVTSLGKAASYSLSTSTAKGYRHSEGYIPNLFVTNHDLVRFGNLLNWKHKISPSSGDQYWGLHRVALALLASYSGPITIYYGDEWGAYVDGYNGPGDLGAYNDNMARSTGKISGFSSDEQKLLDYAKKLMQWRATYPALWKGNVEDLKTEENYYVGKKTLGGEKSIGVILNKGSSAVSYSFSGTDLETGSAFSGSCPAYSAKFILLD